MEYEHDARIYAIGLFYQELLTELQVPAMAISLCTQCPTNLNHRIE